MYITGDITSVGNISEATDGIQVFSFSTSFLKCGEGSKKTSGLEDTPLSDIR